MEQSLMDFKETAEYLNISKPTLYRLLQAGQIPAYKVGGQWRFKRDRLEKWLDEQENRGNHEY